MFNIFTSLRYVLAVDKSFKILSAVAADAINRVVIPSLESMMDSANNPDEKIKYEALIGEYREYANPRSSKYEEFAEIAGKILGGFSRKFNRGMQDASEVAQNIASNFYMKPTWLESFTLPRFDVRKGPVALKHHWATILYKQGEYEYR